MSLYVNDTRPFEGLPDRTERIAELQTQLAERDKLLEQREATILEKKARIAELEIENDRLMNFDAIRLRRTATKLGISVPESNETLLCCAGTVLGSICRAIDDIYADREAALKAERLAGKIEGLEDAATGFDYIPWMNLLTVGDKLRRMANELKEQS